MKILTLCYEYPPIGGGGGRVAKAIAEALAARGHEVRVQTAALGVRSIRETINGVDVSRTASFRRAPDTCRVHEMGLYWMTSLLPTLGHIRTWKPDVIHAHFAMPTGLLAWQVHRLTGRPYVITAHLGDVPGGVPEQTDRLFRIVGPLARMVWREAAACTAVSSFVQELGERAYGREIRRILNGIELGDRPDAPSELNQRRHLVFLGRFNAQKCPAFLIHALRLLSSTNWKLTMIGDGPLMREVRALAADSSFKKRVNFTGWLDAAGVQAILREADVLCMPSTSEGMPVAAIEAIKHGLAIVASDIPGVRDVVDDGVNGYRVSLGDADAFASRLESLLRSDETLRGMKQASWAKACEFDLHRIVEAYEEVLTKAASYQ